MSISVAILGASGVVGQKVIALLAKNNKFTIEELVTSSRREGKVYEQSCDWHEELPMPQNIRNKIIVGLQDIKSDYVISCLPAKEAMTIEPFLAEKGKIIFSNASAFRMHTNVPLLIPEVNIHHISLLKQQHTEGKIITNPNCAAVGVALALRPLMDLETIKHVSVVTLQSISGAGYSGINSMAILNNTIPYIAQEAEKITTETKKILGEKHKKVNFAITTNVHRVPVKFGHVVNLHISFSNKVSASQVNEIYMAWNSTYNNLYKLYDDPLYPQSLNLTADDMRVHIGNIAQGDGCNIISLITLTHNLVRGAAGAVISNLESYLNYNI